SGNRSSCPLKRPCWQARETAQSGGNLTLRGQTRIGAVRGNRLFSGPRAPEISERPNYLGGEQLQMSLRPPRRQRPRIGTLLLGSLETIMHPKPLSLQ